MERTIEAFAERDTPGLWLDYYAYAARLFAGGQVPWLDQVAFSAFHAKAQGLLRSGVVELPVEDVAEALVRAAPDIAARMRARRRSGYPLRALLEEPRLREAVAQLLDVLRPANADIPLVLGLPSPRRWLALASRQAWGDESQESDLSQRADDDEVSAAAMYVADFLRAFAEKQVDALLLIETPGQSPQQSEALALYDPVINKAVHYRWEMGILDRAATPACARERGVSFVIAPVLDDGQTGGRLMEAAFWNGTPPPALGRGGFRYARVPEDALPEAVLQRLAEVA